MYTSMSSELKHTDAHRFYVDKMDYDKTKICIQKTTKMIGKIGLILFPEVV